MDPHDVAREHVARLIADLSRPEAYPFPVDEVTLEETHISLAFLAGDFVYKVKKPVDFGFLDFSTLERRKFFCQEEVRLNRRLTSNVYLDVVPVLEVGNRLSFTGEGDVVDYAVVMRRLPEACMLRRLVDNDEVEEQVFEWLSERLARFYAEARTGAGVDEWGTVEAVWRNIEENIEQTRKYVGTVAAPIELQLIAEVSRDFLDNNAALIAARVAAGKVREAHGDLHLAHIFVEGTGPEGLQIIDGVEFNPRLGCMDIAADIAFLAMDLTYHGRPDLAERAVSLLAERLDDPELPRLAQFFAVYRAHVRAKVACFRLDELAPELPEYFAVRTEAERYFDLATSFIAEPARPTLFVVGGLSGTGKSVISRRLARALGLGLVSSDAVRLELAGRTPGSKEPAEFGAGIYSTEFTERTYLMLLDRGAEHLQQGNSVVLDATFLNPTWRRAALELAERLARDFVFIECQCSPAVVRERLAHRARELLEPSEADWAVYQRQRERYGPAIASDEQPGIVVDTDRPSALVLEDILRQLDLARRL
ncbi:MAG TPA: AAA family ATPase [Thermomicrobiaceae bacterium]|nr:AAA family ATPase [Thermomicrobiaceae bacterium]